jgi:hypothetical protein
MPHAAGESLEHFLLLRVPGPALSGGNGPVSPRSCPPETVSRMAVPSMKKKYLSAMPIYVRQATHSPLCPAVRPPTDTHDRCFTLH